MAESLASSLRICRGDLKIYIVKAMNAEWRVLTEPSEWSEQNVDVSLCWQILSLNDLGVHWWNSLRLLQRYTPLRFRDILLVFLWTQRIVFLPNAGHTCCQLRLWSLLLKLFGLITPQERWATFGRKKHLQKDKVSSATALLEKQVIRVCVYVYVCICLMKRYL